MYGQLEVDTRQEHLAIQRDILEHIELSGSLPL
jgi:hypothetical protein